MPIHSLLLLLITLFIYVYPTISLSDNDSAYQVEMIVFSHITPSNLSEENLNEQNQYPNYFNQQPFQDKRASITATDQKAVRETQLLLRQEAMKLQKHAKYKILLHKGWKMTFLNGTQQLRLFGGKAYEENDLILHTFEGFVNIQKKRYFTVSLNSLFSMPRPESFEGSLMTNELDSHLVHFHWTQKRRMRSNELNYLDFPLYGILIKIIPLHKKKTL